MKNVVYKIGCLLLTLAVIMSCGSEPHFTVVSPEEALHDTLLHTNNLYQKQQGVIDSLNAILQLTLDSMAVKNKKLADNENTFRELKNIVAMQQQAVYDLEQQVCEALKCFTPDELKVKVRNGKLYVSLSDKLLFPTGSDKVNERGKLAIKQLSDVLKNSKLEIIVEGHTDKVPIHNARNHDNWDLSVHRATSVTRLLMENGIEAQRITAAGHSKFAPVATNKTEAGRQKNRRTEIVLAPNLDKLWELTAKQNFTNSVNLSNLK